MTDEVRGVFMPRNPAETYELLGTVPGARLALEMNPIGPDGPVHPGHLYIARRWLTVLCPHLGRVHAAPNADNGGPLTQQTALVARDWGCTWLTVHLVDEDGGGL